MKNVTPLILKLFNLDIVNLSVFGSELRIERFAGKKAGINWS